MIFEFQRQRQQEKKQIKASLEDYRKVRNLTILT